MSVSDLESLSDVINDVEDDHDGDSSTTAHSSSSTELSEYSTSTLVIQRISSAHPNSVVQNECQTFNNQRKKLSFLRPATRTLNFKSLYQQKQEISAMKNFWFYILFFHILYQIVVCIVFFGYCFYPIQNDSNRYLSYKNVPKWFLLGLQNMGFYDSVLKDRLFLIGGWLSIVSVFGSLQAIIGFYFEKPRLITVSTWILILNMIFYSWLIFIGVKQLFLRSFDSLDMKIEQFQKNFGQNADQIYRKSTDLQDFSDKMIDKIFGNDDFRNDGTSNFGFFQFLVFLFLGLFIAIFCRMTKAMISDRDILTNSMQIDILEREVENYYSDIMT